MPPSASPTFLSGNISVLQRIKLLAVLFMLVVGSVAQGVTVRTIDGKDFSGQLVSLDAGTLTVAVRDGNKEKRQSVRLDEIVSIDMAGFVPVNPAVVEPSSTTQPGSPSTTQPAAGRPADAISWRLVLLCGDQLTGFIDGWSATTITLSSSDLGKPIPIPLQDVKEIWQAGSLRDDVPESVALNGGLEDIALVKSHSDDRIQGVRGTVVGLTNDALIFRYGGEERQIDPARLVGIVLATHQYTPSDKLQMSFTLVSGDMISGEWTSLKNDAAAVRTIWAADVLLPLARVSKINVINGRLTYLSELTPIKVEQVPYFDRILPYRIDSSLRGGKGLTLTDGTYAKGIAMHSRSLLHYDIGGKFEFFRARVGMLQPDGKLGRAAVRVLGDGKPLYENPDLRGDQKPVDLGVNLTGVRRLTLEVDYGHGQDVGDQVGWADVKLLRPAMK